jgi:hypothetical protein
MLKGIRVGDSLGGVMRVLVLAMVVSVSGGLTASCASTAAWNVGEHPTVLWQDAQSTEQSPSTPLSEGEARRIARAHDHAHSCESSARAMRRRDAERGFAVMRQCILRTDFGDLEALLDSEWSEQIAASPDAVSLFAHVIAVRGGDVDADLRLLRRRKVPIYSLQAALAEPDAYKDRFILVRGVAKGGRSIEGGRELSLKETKVMTESEWVTAPGSTRLATKHQGTTVDQPGIDVVGRGRIDDHHRSETVKVEIERNVSVETGREIVARLTTGEPSLEPATDFVVVLRFVGVAPIENAEGEAVDEPVGIITDYFEPETSRFARLSR